MRTLKYALLGLINREPITGYDITKEFEHRIMANFWHAKHSQVYPELKKLTDERLIEYKVIIQGEKMEKKLYTITPKGHDQFIQWIRQDEALDVTPKDVFRLRTYFTDFLEVEDYKKLLNSQIFKHNARLNILNSSYKDFNNTVPSYGTREFGDYSVLLGAVMRETFYINWLKICLENVTYEH